MQLYQFGCFKMTLELENMNLDPQDCQKLYGHHKMKYQFGCFKMTLELKNMNLDPQDCQKTMDTIE